MNSAKALFLELLSAAIWERSADSQLFESVDSNLWEQICELAIDQKVVALIFDGVLSLPPELHPEKKIIFKLHLQSESIERTNNRINNVLKKLSAEYEKLGCPFVLLKGPANAFFYPNPLHRTTGDIDAFLYQKGDYQKANNWARSKGLEMEPENIHHQAFRYEGVLIENHKWASYFGIRKFDKLLEQKVDEINANNEFLSIDIDGVEVKVLPHEFNAFFLFQHLFHHFIHLGVGIRQLCDWVLFCDRYSSLMDKDAFLRLAIEFELLYGMQIFASVAVKYLGANPSIFPFAIDTDDENVDMVMDDIFSGGSFGYAIFQNKRFRTSLHRKWYSFRYSSKRLRKIHNIAPSHTANLPLNKVMTNIKVLFK